MVKSTLIKLEKPALQITNVLENISTRKQYRNETALQFGQALQSLANGVLSSDTELKELFFRGLKDNQLKREVALKITGSGGSISMDNVVKYAAELEKSWNLADNFIKIRETTSEDNSSDNNRFNKGQQNNRNQYSDNGIRSLSFGNGDHRPQQSRPNNAFNRSTVKYNESSLPSSYKASVTCFNCDKVGHVRSDCNAPLRQKKY